MPPLKKSDASFPILHNRKLFRYTPRSQDIDAIETILKATGFFKPYEIDVGLELVYERLSKGLGSGYEFVLWDGKEGLVGYCCYGAIPCTLSSFDIYWIAVHPDFQKKGIGKRIYSETETRIQNLNGTRIYIETSQSKKYLLTRKFYESVGFERIALIKDFYGPGDGKVIYCKVL